MKPLVGVMPLWDDAKDSIWMLPGYLEGLKEAGATPVIFPLTEDPEEISRLVDICDGILMTGGHDVTPSIYGEEPLEDKVSCCRERDNMEKLVLEDTMKKDKPILGICRGIQLINALLGGTLFQDLPSQHPSDIEHHQTPPYDVPVHDVIIRKVTPLFDCLGSERISVNSYHHQAVKDLAPGLEVMAESEDGIVEALYKPLYSFLWAVQWHPEFSYKTDSNSMKIFQAFVERISVT
ncbi:MAG: gamma-glutamyl-gamma-aminobutyrate hydrolase family protein [Clostridiales bacterium]|nr:gamma-glutamyl-gamma-aminobutyrate hydrolase family protein [Clostridiales bacterium]